MLIAYISDERYVALADVLLEFEGDAGSYEARSRATGSVHADLPPGAYKVTLSPELARRIQLPAYADPARTPLRLDVPSPVGIRTDRLRTYHVKIDRLLTGIPEAIAKWRETFNV